MTDPPAGARQVSVPVDRLSRWLDGFASRHGAVDARGVGGTVCVAGADGARAWLTLPWLPPPPDGVAVPLTAFVLHAGRPHRVGVLLVRRGGYAVGIFEGAQLQASKVGSAYVQGTTKAGGWSQQRYARRRTNQAAAAFAEAADVAARVLVPETERLGALVRGGDRAAVQAVLADPRLAGLAALPSGPLLAVPDPRLRVLQATPEQFLTAQITLDP